MFGSLMGAKNGLRRRFVDKFRVCWAWFAPGHPGLGPGGTRQCDQTKE
jgi:hypothetical protein